MIVNFQSLKDDDDDKRLMHSNSNNIEIMIGNETDKIIKGLLNHFLLDTM